MCAIVVAFAFSLVQASEMVHRGHTLIGLSAYCYLLGVLAVVIACIRFTKILGSFYGVGVQSSGRSNWGGKRTGCFRLFGAARESGRFAIWK